MHRYTRRSTRKDKKKKVEERKERMEICKMLENLKNDVFSKRDEAYCFPISKIALKKVKENLLSL